MTGRLRAVMISVPERRRERELTLKGLAAAGISPEVSVQHDPERSNHAHVRHCLAAIDGRGPVLLLEDDLLIDVATMSPAVEAAAVMAEEADTACWLYLPGDRHYPARLSPSAWAKRPVVFPLIAARRLIGSLAVVISHRVTSELATVKDPQGGFDVVLRDHLIARGRPLLGVAPNPVQHQTGRSTIPRHTPHRAARSTTFPGQTREMREAA